ncbi:radical SAM protein [candidate division KSB3 bacterium]|uniref:Radical SAM protein n=1 Tax=candidate division KSB3 bacterium TaxID=2044937 RepID=A0A9D5Q8R8_9BACT|nr:radical SAM protein [candidate division KSB3 bacterium]MBD3327657.1 radical SAM protein [candidate division KSB3 bacterium]
MASSPCFIQIESKNIWYLSNVCVRRGHRRRAIEHAFRIPIRMTTYAFANILFSGRCNLRCPYCIGQSQPLQAMPDNLQSFPLKGLERFIEEVQRHGISQISLTGTNTDPQLYAHEVQLIDYLRQAVPGVKISLHTNGRRVLHNLEVFNRYDRATISLPSFIPETCRKMTGSARVLELGKIVEGASIPIKISTLITGHNICEIPAILARCREVGIHRMVLRKLYGDPREWNLFPDHTPIRYFGGNPVYELDGMEVTIWDFSASQVRCLNLFSDGTISQEYQLTRRTQ